MSRINIFASIFYPMSEGMEDLPKEEENVDRLESIDRTLRELLTWTRFANMEKLKEILKKELDDDHKKLAYENSDGSNGQKEVSALCGAPISTVGKWWPKWFHRGLVTESETRKGRMMKIVSLEDVGIEVPKRSAATPATEAPETNQDHGTPTGGDKAE